MAILLREEGLLERTIIYATDINPHPWTKPSRASFRWRMSRLHANYQQAGGQRSFADYYRRLRQRDLRQDLRENVTFADHSLATDSVFSETQLISCRNVLIYFNKKLQDRRVRLVSRVAVPPWLPGAGQQGNPDFRPTAISSSPWSSRNGSTVNHERRHGQPFY
jgi:chemotaxis methyl-accepting protein methylase